MPVPEPTQMTAGVQRATAWAGVALAAIAVLGLLSMPRWALLCIGAARITCPATRLPRV